MKKIVLVTALAALAACSKPEAAPTADATEQAAAIAAPAAQTVAADGKPSTGTFKITTADGKVYMEEDKPDGTYVEMEDGKVTATGKWVQKSPEQFCTTKHEAGAKERCGTEKVDDKGVWTSVNPDGKTVTIVRVAG